MDYSGVPIGVLPQVILKLRAESAEHSRIDLTISASGGGGGAEAKGLVQVWIQPRLYSKVLSQNQKQRKS